MRRLLLLPALAAAGLAASLALAAARQSTHTHSGVLALRGKSQAGDADEKAIRQNADTFTKAFNDGDAKAVAALWTLDGEYVDEEGTTLTGREAIQKEYADFFKQHPKARLQVDIETIRVLGPEVAMEDGTTRLSEPPVGAISTALYSIVHVKRDGKWQMARVRDVDSAPLSNYAVLRNLEPMVGSWALQNGDVRTESQCQWVANRNWLRRTFETHRGKERVSAGVQMIGVDPTTGQLASWEFDGDGGMSRTEWHPDGDKWIGEAEGVTRDGRPTTAVNVIKFQGKNGISWQSVDRMLDGVAVSDVPEMKVVRTK